jgi:hypothetical protein
MDERSILHRYKATRLAMAAGVLAIGGVFFYEYIKGWGIRWDLFAILGIIASVKVAARVYYGRFN